VILGLSLAAAILLLLVALLPSTDDFSPDNPLWNGLSLFCSQFNATVVAPAGVSALSRSAALLVVGPSRAPSAAEALELRRFVEEGGLLVVADDFGAGNQVLELLGARARISGALLEDGVYMFRSPLFPRALARANGTSIELYLNYASTVEPSGAGACLASSSLFNYLDLNLNGRRDEGEPYGPFCVAYAEPLGSGRVVVISDPSLFINSMLGYGGNGAFLRWLLGGRRVYVLGGLWSEGAYTVARSRLLALLDFAYGSALRYVSVPLTGLAIYAIVLVVARRLRRPAEGRRDGQRGGRGR